MPVRVPEDMPEHIAEDMPGRMPEVEVKYFFGGCWMILGYLCTTSISSIVSQMGRFSEQPKKSRC